MKRVVDNLKNFLIKNLKTILFIYIIANAVIFLNPISARARSFRLRLGSLIEENQYLNFNNGLIWNFTPFQSFSAMMLYTPLQAVLFYGGKFLIAFVGGMLVSCLYKEKKSVVYGFWLFYALLEVLQVLFAVGHFDIDGLIFSIIGYAAGALATYFFTKKTSVKLPVEA